MKTSWAKQVLRTSVNPTLSVPFFFGKFDPKCFPAWLNSGLPENSCQILQDGDGRVETTHKTFGQLM